MLDDGPVLSWLPCGLCSVSMCIYWVRQQHCLDNTIQNEWRELPIGCQYANCNRCLVLQGIKERDGYDCNVDDLYLTEGASGAVKNILQIMIRDEKDAILIPYPQYPLYSAAIALLGGTVVPYYPDEKKGWQIDPAHLQDVLEQVHSLASPTLVIQTCIDFMLLSIAHFVNACF